MENSFKYIRKTRELFLSLVEGLSLEQLNEIPEGFNNNIIWNFGHIIVSTLGLAYVRSGVAPDFKIPFGAQFAKGSRPEGFIGQQTVDALKGLLISSIDQIESDVQGGVFDKITPYSTATYGYTMDSFAEVLVCTLAHDNMHLGIVKAQRAIVINDVKSKTAAHAN